MISVLIFSWWFSISSHIDPFLAGARHHAEDPRPTSSLSSPEIYYVDSKAGNDTNSGTSPQKAWKSLAMVNNHVFRPGDRLLFKAGTLYEGQLAPKGKGLKNRPIVIDGYGKGVKPEIRGRGAMPAALWLHNTEYWEICNLCISNEGNTRVAGRYGVLVSLKDFGTAHHIELKGLEVRDVNGSLVKKEGGGAGIVASNEGEQVPSRFDGLLIANCTIRNTARNGILINGNWMRNKWYPSRGVVIRKNLLEGVPGDGIVPIGCDSALIEYNVMRNCPAILPDGEAAAGIWPWSCDHTLIQYNEVSDHHAPWDGQGFDSDWNCRNTIIQYNYSHDNEGGFLLICNDGSARMPQSVGNTGSIVRYNLSVNDGFRTGGKHAGFSPSIHVVGSTKNSMVYNNVIFITGRTANMDSTLVQMGNWNGLPDSTFFFNNIFYVKGVVNYDLNLATHVFFKNNLYFGNHLERPEDSDAVIADPLFVKVPEKRFDGWEATKGFMLKEGSPARGKGKPIINKAFADFFGNPVSPLQAPSIGIHQAR